MESLLHGLLIGGLIGLSIGPVAVWGARVRHEGYRPALVIIIGGTVGDCVLAILVLAALRYIGELYVHQFVQWLAAAVPATLMGIGMTLFKMERHGAPESDEVWRGGRFAGAFTGTFFRPDTILLTVVWFLAIGRPGDDAALLLAGFSIGACALWHVSVEWLYRTHRWPRLHLMADGLITCCAAGCVLGAFITPFPAL